LGKGGAGRVRPSHHSDLPGLVIGATRRSGRVHLYFRQQNDQLRKRGVYLEIVRWENFLDAMSETRLQDEYNKEIRACDIFVCLFFTRTGKFTEEEFGVAHRQFQGTGRPRIFTFFKDADVRTGSARKEDLNSLWAFRDKLQKLGHFHTLYQNTEDLKLQFHNQLERLLEQRDVASNLLN
jgi:internalin A